MTAGETHDRREPVIEGIRVDVHVHLHLPEPVKLVVQHIPGPAYATGQIHTIGGTLSVTGNTNIDVDTTDATVTLQFVDDKGDVTTPPDGISVSFSVDDETVLTVSNDPNSPNVGNLSLLKAGTAVVAATPSGATAPDGSPFAAQSVTLTIEPGAAVGDQIVVNP